MSKLEKAISIALDAHKGKLDKAGMPYILHPLRVMFKMKKENEMIAAVLHDVVEDSEITFEQLKNEGFSNEVIDAVKSLTRLPEETYEEFIERACNNPVGLKIKKADIIDNMNMSRIKNITDNDLKRLMRYHKAFWAINDKESL
ncbi:MAG: HD domain-containing protein [Desulfobacterales bacterium]|nr:HD domain-containing protein [Desulfobacterales bacterium]